MFLPGWKFYELIMFISFAVYSGVYEYGVLKIDIIYTLWGSATRDFQEFD